MTRPQQPAPADRFAVAAQLRALAELLALEGANRFRTRAYERAAQTIEGMTADFDALLRSNRLHELPGIGAALARTIEELAATGRTATLERLDRQYPPGVRELSRVVSLGQARALHEALGTGTVEELRDACAAGRVRRVRGFGERTEQRLLARIDGLAERPERVLLPEAVRQIEALSAYVRPHPAVTAVEPAGQVRRRIETVDRLDLVIAARDRAPVLAHLHGYRRAFSVSHCGRDALAMRQAGGVPATVRVVASEELPAVWIDATGSAGHVEKLRARAAGRGLTLTDRALLRSGRPLPIRSEAELYERLGVAYVPAELREDTGEIEAAADGSMPQNLVRLEDVQGAVHCHTAWSDGKHSIEEMARAAAALGMRYLTITDHSTSATYAKGLNRDRLRRQRDEIARVQERVDIRILRGTESDILRDGSLDFPDPVLAELDVVIASVHNRYRMDADEMTRRLIRALRHPLFKIWGHALGRYVLSRPPFACHMDEVLDAVAGARAAIEVNGDPNRLDLEPPWIRAARRRGIRFVLSSDAHSVNGLRNLRWAVDMARRGWLQKGDVLNTLAPAAFAAAVRP
jgi:DNA polymerase (family 10)